MKISKFALTAMVASACCAGTAFGQSNRSAPRYYPASYYSYYQDGSQAPVASASDAKTTSSACCDKGSACDVADICNGKGGKGGSCDSMGSCDCGNGACDGGCGSGCGSSGLIGLGLIGTGRKLDDPWKLCPNGIGNTGIKIGGWTDIGYHSRSTPNNFNTYPHKVQLQQQWFFAEKVADGSKGLGFGARIDYIYGTDAPDTQAFGAPARTWDNPWDNSSNLGYGHAIPQLYGEVASGKLSAKFGHFFTIIGNEVVQATGNFFYSRQFTFYNAEPFTHTGGLTTYNLDEDTQIYNGYVAGWDSGFYDNGSAYLGGFKRKLSDKLSVLYSTCMGRMGDSNQGVQERGNHHSVIMTAKLTDKLTYISQTDSLNSRNAGGAQQRNTFGNINYLLYKVNDRITLGERFEWFNYTGAGFNNAKNDDLYNLTTGINYRASANLLFRPEVRWVWDEARYGFNAGNVPSATVFGGDMLFTF